MSCRIAICLYFLIGSYTSLLAEDAVTNLLQQFRNTQDEKQKSELVVALNRSIPFRSTDAAKTPTDNAHDSDRARIALELRRALDSAESLELVSILAHSWWMHEDKTKVFTEETQQLVFSLLDDQRTTGQRSSPATPHTRAITILSTCPDSVETDVVELLGHAKPSHRAAGIRILSARGYFEKNYQTLARFADSEDELVQAAVGDALGFIQSDRDQAITVAIQMHKQGKATNQVNLALAKLAGSVGEKRAAGIQKVLLNSLAKQTFYGNRDRAIALIMQHLSKDDQRDAVERIIPHLNTSNTWLERAVIVAGTDGQKALPYFIEQFKKSDDKKKLRRAIGLWEIERDPNRVIALFLKGIDNERSTERWYAFKGLTSMGENAQVAVPKLTRLLESENPILVRQSLAALAATKTHSKATHEAIQKVVDSHTNKRTVEAAKAALSALQTAN